MIITDEFINNTEVWIVKLEKYVKDIFVLLFNFEIAVLGIRALINRKSLEDIFGELIMAAVVGGVIYTCIMNYSEWSNSIINGISKYAGLLNNTDINTFDSIHKGFEIFKAIITASAGPIDRIVFFLCGVIIFICFALINIQIIYIKCEASVAVSAAFILLGFGGCSIFRDYAMNLMRYIISVGFKLFVMYAVLGLGFGFIQNKWL